MTLLQPNVPTLDELIDKDETSAILNTVTDYEDAIRIILYLHGVWLMTISRTKREEYIDVCYTLALSHGALSLALELVLVMNSREKQMERVRELYSYCTDLTLKPEKLCSIVKIGDHQNPKAAPPKAADITPQPTPRATPPQPENDVRIVDASGTSPQIADDTKQPDPPGGGLNTQTNAHAQLSSWTPTVCINWHHAGDEAERSVRRLMKLQLTHQLSQHGFVRSFEELGVKEPNSDDELSMDLCLRGEQFAEMLDVVAKELELDVPKNVDVILRSADDEDNSKNGRRVRVRAPNGLDSARLALAQAYASSFVHAGYGLDEAVLSDELLTRCKHHGITAAIACRGLLHLGRVDSGLCALDKFQYSQDAYTRAGAALGFAASAVKAHHECDPVLSLVGESGPNKEANEKMASMMALGYAYCGSARADVLELLVPSVLFVQASSDLEVSCTAALAAGLVAAGSGDEQVSETLLQAIQERVEWLQGLEADPESQDQILTGPGVSGGSMDAVYLHQLAVAIGLVFLQRTEEAEPAEELLRAMEHPLALFCAQTLSVCAWVGSNDVLRSQKFLKFCMERVNDLAEADEKAAGGESGGGDATDEEEAAEKAAAALVVDNKAPDVGENAASTAAAGATAPPARSRASDFAKNVREEFENVLPAIAVLGMPLLHLTDPLGNDMLQRLLTHMLQFDGLFVRRAVPIALALSHVSWPQPNVVETLAKLTREPDADTAMHAIISLGLVSAGTNNARVAQVLRTLASYYSVDPQAVFLVRLAQALLFLGKGMHTLSPTYCGRTLINPAALIGVITFAVQLLFTKDTLCHGRYHLNMLHLILAIRPRWLVTVDETGKTIPLQVRVGQSQDVAGVTGQPKQLSGYRTQHTPLLLAAGEKAEIGTADYQPFAQTLEGVVVVRKTPRSEHRDAVRFLE